QIALGIAYVRGRSGHPVGMAPAILFWAGEIAAIFLKGPVGFALALLTIATLGIADRKLRWLRQLHPLVGLAATAICVAPWLIEIEHATAGRFLGEAAGGDLFSKLAGAQELHGAPPLSYLLLAVVSFWPGSLLLVPALWRGWRRRDRPAERFLLAWLLPAWVALELVPTKLPHYVLPLYPALALLAAGALLDGVRLAAGSWQYRIDLAVRGLWLLATLALAALPILLSLRFAGHLVPAALVPAILLPALTAALFFLRSERADGSSTDAVLHPLPHSRREPGSTHPASDPLQNGSRLSPGMRFLDRGLRREVTAMAALALAFAVPTAVVLPALDRVWLSRAVAAMVAQHKPAEGMKLAAVGYAEPSLVFLLGTGLDLTSPGDAATLLADGGEAIVSSRVDAVFQQALAARGLVLTPLGSAAGLDYSNGQRMVLTLYEIAGTGH
ncbi:MAG: ArnT family glycosyltransferase, partial [Thiohalocapsa sp.]